MNRKRVVSLCTTAALLACLVLGGSGCGWFFVHGPPAGYQRMNDFSCTQSIAGPVLDFAGFLWFTINMDVNAQHGAVAATAIDGALTVAYVWAGLDGARKISACRAARLQMATGVKPAPAPFAGQPAVYQPGPVKPAVVSPAPAPPKTPKPVTLQPAASVAAPAQPAKPQSVTQQPVASPDVHAIVVSPAVDSLNVGQTVQLAAVARTSSGAIVPGRVFIWRSLHRSVASVSRAGLVTARAVGVAIITAKTGDVTGRARIVVVK